MYSLVFITCLLMQHDVYSTKEIFVHDILVILKRNASWLNYSVSKGHELMTVWTLSPYLNIQI